MDIWSQLGQLVEKRQQALIITLVEEADKPHLVGAMATRSPGDEKWHGPLVEAPFWADDSPALFSAATSVAEAGVLVNSGGRRYLVSRLNYGRSALVLGGGHVGDAVCRLLRFLDFEVTLMDDRAEFLKKRQDGVSTVEAPFSQLTSLFSNLSFDAVIIVTRGHAQDTGCLRQVLSWPLKPPYVGMIGSRHRTAETLKMLAAEGFAAETLQKVHTPIGLKIGAQTPAEIAVSIAAEIIQELNSLYQN